ncbi:DNA integrity scanning protein DisA nucleotide-binding domain protein [Hymenobacter weizhouensis]|uniref:DNA integrity scanning protein DisA nucleotide-binding domain protein n=1 Tax=Hymenobacter sp. YIM 151500-1 TaxID=2987689 RepID=UPI002227C97D|nr:DNA integrity scanning protein DisA nucleotide-binding domain protein [Hymenobacter sp. YIM 151500-1]UYZ63126.1 DNA integrity scanning protein DisA nucleotide-binding domain protein [Hymenobacter sp. YIM 151500-1]
MHYYPSDLANALRSRWPDATAVALPSPPVLTQFISVAYQASLLSEEARPVVGQLVFASAEALEAHVAGQRGQHVLLFEPARAYTEQELRRLSPTVHRAGNLLAVDEAADGSLRIWGLLATQYAWELPGETPRPSMGVPPAALLLRLHGPGNLIFNEGPTRVLTLQRGRVDGHGFVQFPVAWSRGRFDQDLEYAQEEMRRMHLTPQPVPDELLSLLGLHLQHRILARVRASGHGGLLVFVPSQNVAGRVGPAAILQPKYTVGAASAGPRFHQLATAIIWRLSELGQLSSVLYRQSADPQLRALEAEMDQFADLLADMMAVDGALILTKDLRVIGFGVEVYAPHVAISEVYRALDMEATAVQSEAANSGGTRHRAAYRLCLADPDSLAIVVSQDGGVRFVHQHAGRIVFWDQL